MCRDVEKDCTKTVDRVGAYSLKRTRLFAFPLASNPEMIAGTSRLAASEGDNKFGTSRPMKRSDS